MPGFFQILTMSCLRIMLIAENDRPFLKVEYPVDIQGMEHEVVGQPKSQREALF